MQWDIYQLVYRISSNFLPYFTAALVVNALLGYSLYRATRNLRFLRKMRKALAVYIEEHR